MNEQKSTSRSSIEWTRLHGRRGYTWNPIGGCFHDCAWLMPDNQVADCYAGTVANGLAQGAYPKGFNHHYWHPDRLSEPLKVKEPAGIFIGSMSDLMGHWVPDEQVNAVLDTCRQAKQHVFFLLTKNAPRLLKFEFPANVWVGVSMPPDWFMSKRISLAQQARMLAKSLEVLDQVKAPVRWMSFEPLSWPVAPILGECPPLEWAVIGAASRGREYYQPDPNHVISLCDVLDRRGTRLFYKGNLRGNPAADPWREEWPEVAI